MKNSKNKTKKNHSSEAKKTYRYKFHLNDKILNKNKNKNNHLVKKGGTPKINFAYTYLIIDYESFQKNFQYLQVLNKFILEKSFECNCRSLNSPVTQCNLPSQKLMINSKNERIILVLKYDDFVNITNDISILTNPAILNKILGHCKIIEYMKNDIPIIGIYDVCLHLTERKGYGSVLFNVILTGIDSIPNLPRNTLLWLGISLQNVQFDKIANLYTNRGFENPYLDTKDLNGVDVGFPFVGLTKYNSTYINNEDTTFIAYSETLDLYNQSKRELSEVNYIPRFQFTFDKSAILSLRLFPYIGHEGITNIITKNLQYESSGVFHIYNTNIENNNGTKITYKLSLETLSNNQGIKYYAGKAEEVIYPLGCCTFHTHPIAAYLNHNVLIGPPSGPDYVSFYSGIFNNFHQFHMIISIEGIYIISLSQEILQNNTFYTNYNIQSDFIREMMMNYSYPIKDPQYSYNWISNNELNPSLVPNAVHSYFEWFKKANLKYQNLFELQFFPWKNIQRDTVMQIYYIKYNNKIFTPVKLPNTYPNNL